VFEDDESFHIYEIGICTSTSFFNTYSENMPIVTDTVGILKGQVACQSARIDNLEAAIANLFDITVKEGTEYGVFSDCEGGRVKFCQTDIGYTIGDEASETFEDYLRYT
jgi:predicted TIM-barrel enzyme